VKALCRWSGLICFAAFLCFPAYSFGQGTANIKAKNARHLLLNLKPSSLLAFTTGDDWYKGGKGGKGGGCNSNDDKWGGKCSAAPEGGAPLMYLLLAGVSCLGAMVLRSRRQGSLGKTIS
jgi:hypothetical protein